MKRFILVGVLAALVAAGSVQAQYRNAPKAPAHAGSKCCVTPAAGIQHSTPHRGWTPGYHPSRTLADVLRENGRWGRSHGYGHGRQSMDCSCKTHAGCAKHEMRCGMNCEKAGGPKHRMQGQMRPKCGQPGAMAAPGSAKCPMGGMMAPKGASGCPKGGMMTPQRAPGCSMGGMKAPQQPPATTK